MIQGLGTSMYIWALPLGMMRTVVVGAIPWWAKALVAIVTALAILAAIGGAFGILFVSTPLWAWYVYRYRKEVRAKRLLKMLEEGVPIRTTAGWLEFRYVQRAKWSQATFRPMHPSTHLHWKHASGYTFLYGAGRGGIWVYVRLPAHRVEDPCCRGMYIASVFPETAWTFSGQVEVSSVHGDWARGEVRASGPGRVQATVQLLPSKARKARLELVARHPSFSGAAREPLAEVSQGSVVVDVDLRGTAEPVQLIVVKMSRGALYRTFACDVAGLGPSARYMLKLVLDIPRAPDIEAETPVSTLPATSQ